jgi:hypothetical protein
MWPILLSVTRIFMTHCAFDRCNTVLGFELRALLYAYTKALTTNFQSHYVQTSYVIDKEKITFFSWNYESNDSLIRCYWYLEHILNSFPWVSTYESLKHITERSINCFSSTELHPFNPTLMLELYVWEEAFTSCTTKWSITSEWAPSKGAAFTNVVYVIWKLVCVKVKVNGTLT